MNIREYTFHIAVAALLLSVILLIIQLTGGQGRDYINPRTPAHSGTPFSGAVMIGDTLHLSGMLGIVNGQVPADPADEVRAMLNAVQGALEEADMTMDDLVSVTVYCSDLSLYDTFNDIYRSYFTTEFPTRAFIASPPLLLGARFELQSVAVKR